MNSLSKIELKAFVPARGFGRSKQFYQDVGFTLASDADGVAYFHHENTGFLLQTSTGRSTPKISRCICWSKTLMHGGRKSKKENLGKYGVKTLPPEQRPWRMRDFVLVDPSGILWRIAENTAIVHRCS